MNFGLRILSQYIEPGKYAAWYFDGVNQIGNKVFAGTRGEAISKLRGDN